MTLFSKEVLPVSGAQAAWLWLDFLATDNEWHAKMFTHHICDSAMKTQAGLVKCTRHARAKSLRHPFVYKDITFHCESQN